MAINVGRVGLQSPEMLTHHLHLGLEHVVLLVRLASKVIVPL